ncbi:hypothetical protein [Aeoliella mucimassa]|uniref:Uncharacterized protein n=1 Tax=Aeoliella mucimassa TaxID=2527972 RepID=A0A518AUS0_9BACT|nr:hypothetical protein [Aeoliella mucimassa]QDU58466.1 hypothetical protein Pan181_47030 [Aeoliella mucimassa]
MLLPVFALLLLVISGLMLDQHRRTWLEAKHSDSIDNRDQRAARAQYLRRMRASGAIGVIALLLIVKPIVPREPLLFTLYVLVLVVLCGWIFMLALVDSFATQLRLRRSRRETASLEAKLEAELQEFRKQHEKD